MWSLSNLSKLVLQTLQLHQAMWLIIYGTHVTRHYVEPIVFAVYSHLCYKTLYNLINSNPETLQDFSLDVCKHLIICHHYNNNWEYEIYSGIVHLYGYWNTKFFFLIFC